MAAAALGLLLVTGTATGSAQEVDTAGEPAPAGTFANPIVGGPGGAADPWMVHHGGRYYITYTATTRLVVRTAASIADLSESPEHVVWDPAIEGEPPSRSHSLWAPELHRLRRPDGQHRWYFYYSAGDGTWLSEKRLHVLESAGDDPLGPYHYKAPLRAGHSIDPTVHVAADGRTYLLWSQHRVAPQGVGHDTGLGQSLWIARLQNPWTVGARHVQISNPTLPWELVVPTNEAPEAMLSPDGRLLHVVYSAGSCNHDHYALGQLTVPADADLLDPLTWVGAKHPLPVFSQSYRTSVHGTGHNGFFTSPDGTETWIVYHAWDTPGAPVSGDGGCTPARTARAQEIAWSADGRPWFGEPVRVTDAQPLPSGDPGPGPSASG